MPEKKSVFEFSDEIRGKILDKISVVNETESHVVIAVTFADKTEVAIDINTKMGARLRLLDWKTGDEEVVRQIGRIPDERQSI